MGFFLVFKNFYRLLLGQPLKFEYGLYIKFKCPIFGHRFVIQENVLRECTLKYLVVKGHDSCYLFSNGPAKITVDLQNNCNKNNNCLNV